MGTNYYATFPVEKAEQLLDNYVLATSNGLSNHLELREKILYRMEHGCPDELLHIGKSSGGWCFSLHVIPERGLNSLEDWKTFLSQPGAVIKDEYGRVYTLPELLKVITERNWRVAENHPFGYVSWEHFHRSNHSQEGPNNLSRHKIDGVHCVGHGDGTWDLVTGEFC